ncbi:hypothetical protein ABPG75_011291 [Micractinium tetrahymenae]
MPATFMHVRETIVLPGQRKPGREPAVFRKVAAGSWGTPVSTLSAVLRPRYTALHINRSICKRLVHGHRRNERSLHCSALCTAGGSGVQRLQLPGLCCAHSILLACDVCQPSLLAQRLDNSPSAAAAHFARNDNTGASMSGRGRRSGGGRGGGNGGGNGGGPRQGGGRGGGGGGPRGMSVRGGGVQKSGGGGGGRGGGRGGRGRGPPGGGRGGRGRGRSDKPKTAEELEREMDEYWLQDEKTAAKKLNDDMDDYWKTAPKKGEEKAAEAGAAEGAAGEAAEAAAPEAAAEEAAAE